MRPIKASKMLDLPESKPAIPEGFKPINSSNLEAVRYNSECQALEVIFKNGGRYIYTGVKPEDFKALDEAESPGRALAAIKANPNITCAKVTE